MRVVGDPHVIVLDGEAEGPIAEFHSRGLAALRPVDQDEVAVGKLVDLGRVDDPHTIAVDP
jgi:hypothetical protein